MAVSCSGGCRRSRSRRFHLCLVLVISFLVTVTDASGSNSHKPDDSVNHQPPQDIETDISREEIRNSKPSGHGNGTEHGDHRYKVAVFDFQNVKMHFIVGIWIIYAGAAKLFFHRVTFLSDHVPESCMLIVIGVLLGLALYFEKYSFYELNTTTFFFVLLPPIILDAGYFMPARPFFDQLGTILLFAVVGTLLNTLWLGFALWGVYLGGGFHNLTQPLLMLHSLVFASLLAAVDPVAVIAVFEAIHVNEILYIVVFGESLLNDGISVVLYHVFEGFSEIGIENIQGIDIFAGFASFFVIVFGATGIGIVMGLFGGVVSRFTHHVRIMEPLMIYVIGYLSFLLAEMFHLSGILSCTFCGITMRKYVEANISPKSKTTIKYLMKIAATCCEIIIFMYLGISAVSDTHHWDTAFCLLTLIFCLIFRALGVVVLTFFANMIRVVKLTKIDQFIMAYGGLRGAIAFALVILLDPHQFPHRKMFITTTILVIYFTNLAMGTTIKPLVEFLKVKRADRRKPTMTEKITNRFMDHMMAGIEDVADQQGHHLLRERFSYLNNKYLKPLIVGRKNPQRQGWQIWSTYNRLNEKSSQHIMRSVNSSASLSVLFRHAFETEMSRSSSLSQLVASPTAMNHSASGYSDTWQWGQGHNGSLSDLRHSQKLDSMVCLDMNSHEASDSRKTRESSKSQHGSEEASRSVKDKRSTGKDGSHMPSATTTTASRLYAPRRQPEYEPRPAGSVEKPTGRLFSHSDVNEDSDTALSLGDLSSGVITFTTRSYTDDAEPQVNIAESSSPWKRQDEPGEVPVQSAGSFSTNVETTGDTAAGSKEASGVDNFGYTER